MVPMKCQDWVIVVDLARCQGHICAAWHPLGTLARIELVNLDSEDETYMLHAADQYGDQRDLWYSPLQLVKAKEDALIEQRLVN